MTLTNSDWVGDLVRKTYGIETVTLYPPAAGGFRRMPWAQRENGFVCIGRINPCKRIEWIVELLDRVRTEIPEVRLHIVGPSDIMPGSHAYRRKLAELFRSNADWVELHENLPREELLELLARNRYGIHAHTDEHFGIAVAEMVLAGCIPFVYDRGGPVEIVGGDSRLLYSSADDAMEKIVRTMTDLPQQENLLTKLAARAQLFSAERFMREVRGIVERALAARQVANPAQPSSIRPQS